MVEKGSTKGLIEKLILRVLKAALWGALTYVFVYYLPNLIYPMDLLPLGYSQFFYLFVGIVVFFAVVTKLFSGTIFEHAFSIARALIMIIYFIAVFNGGIISLTMSMEEAAVNLVINLKAFLAILILVNLLGIAKSMFKVTKFLAKKVETSQLSVR
ncbi:hypothetical protein GWO13_08370 [Candidatus Bathyarchaeota archaeon]|nr:hypothetical protein [Candidatus Bathyarchaeota archaeon]